MKRISQLSENDVAYPSARWAVMEPKWIGQRVVVMAAKTATLRAAIATANHQPLGCEMSSVTLMDAPPHGDPMTVAKAKQWVAHIADRAAEGNKRAIADMAII